MTFTPLFPYAVTATSATDVASGPTSLTIAGDAVAFTTVTLSTGSYAFSLDARTRGATRRPRCSRSICRDDGDARLVLALHPGRRRDRHRHVAVVARRWAAAPAEVNAERTPRGAGRRRAAGGATAAGGAARCRRRRPAARPGLPVARLAARDAGAAPLDAAVDETARAFAPCTRRWSRRRPRRRACTAPSSGSQVPAPPEAKTLVEMKQRGVPQDVLVAVREQHLPRPARARHRAALARRRRGRRSAAAATVGPATGGPGDRHPRPPRRRLGVSVRPRATCTWAASHLRKSRTRQSPRSSRRSRR